MSPKKHKKSTQKATKSTPPTPKPRNTTHMDLLHPTPSHTSSRTVKKVKNAILQEAKCEEKYVKKILKSLSHTEKVEHKAEKEASKAEVAFESSKKQEQDALKDVYRAEHKHNFAVADVVKTRNNLQYLTDTEKSTSKTEAYLKDLETQAQAALKNVYRAEQKHDVALAKVEQARFDLQTSAQHRDGVKNALQRKASFVDDILEKHDDNTHWRNIKLTTLSGPSAATEAGRIIQNVHVPNSGISNASGVYY